VRTLRAASRFLRAVTGSIRQMLDVKWAILSRLMAERRAYEFPDDSMRRVNGFRPTPASMMSGLCLEGLRE
jgi:hypothetical protein